MSDVPLDPEAPAAGDEPSPDGRDAAGRAPDGPDAASPADGVVHALDPRYVPMRQLSAAVATAVLVGGASIPLIVSLFAEPSHLLWQAPSWLAAAGLLAWRAYAWPPLEYRYARYRVDAYGLEIRRGVLWRVVISVPKSRVQHTDVSQGPIERQFGLGTLVVYTAGTDHARVELPGLTYGRAAAIRDHLLPTGGDDAV